MEMLKHTYIFLFHTLIFYFSMYLMYAVSLNSAKKKKRNIYKPPLKLLLVPVIFISNIGKRLQIFLFTFYFSSGLMCAV